MKEFTLADVLFSFAHLVALFTARGVILRPRGTLIMSLKLCQKKSPGELVDKAKATNCDFVVITGGEPAIHDLSPLTSLLKEQSIPCHIETSGGFEIKGDFQWVTLSPKREKLPLDENLKNADEIKVIVDSESAIDEWYTYLSPYKLNAPIWLNIEWSQRENRKLKEQITNFIKSEGTPYRVGLPVSQTVSKRMRWIQTRWLQSR